jgi:hypothetical protein
MFHVKHFQERHPTTRQLIPLPCGAVDPTQPREQESFLDDRNRI